MNTLKNGVQLSKDNGLDLISRCFHVIETTQLKKVKVTKFSIFRMRRVTEVNFIAPFWYRYKADLLAYFEVLKQMLERPDPIFISLLAYEHLIKLSKGSEEANPIFIMNY